MEVYAYTCIHIHTNQHKDIRIYICIYVASNESEKSRSFLSATTFFFFNNFDYEKHPQHLILTVSEFPISISNDAL